MRNVKIVFLDMDGVVNSDDFIMEWSKVHGWDKNSRQEFMQRYYVHDGHEGYIVPELLERLKWICAETDCRIVWSSSWRQSYWKQDPDTGEFNFDWHEIAALWKAKGLPVDRLIGCTPCLDLSRFSYVPRGCEIQKWIDDNSEEYNIVRAAVLDDDPDAETGIENESTFYFQTTFERGLTEDIANDVVKWLNDGY